MTRYLISLALAFSLSATSSAAFAGKPCPWNDQQLPEKSKVCKAGTIQQCQDGQWVSLGIKCTARLREDDRANAAGARRLLGDPSPARDRLVARIAPAC